MFLVSDYKKIELRLFEKIMSIIGANHVYVLVWTCQKVLFPFNDLAYNYSLKLNFLKVILGILQCIFFKVEFTASFVCLR